ncbi:MAG: Txe/YoeB family addiction module toxin [Quinella sp. 2Q5]|nr:Txe/YoeB family addiction module toxin [Quinella sp. 2Q5]
MNKAFSDKAFEQYLYWQRQDRKTLNRINALIKDIDRNGVDKGIGKPEMLKHELAGHWSRRIDETNRLVYKVDEHGTLRIEYCKGHYE